MLPTPAPDARQSLPHSIQLGLQAALALRQTWHINIDEMQA
jgi:hypothetical protein